MTSMRPGLTGKEINLIWKVRTPDISPLLGRGMETGIFNWHLLILLR